ncbi:sugar transferase [Butyrivibrio sp. CB08]|uniref:sugar transferase n=1 Tax=Butyrivibrio sp. CB08 TaxID=2364879 RepID=UPI001FAA1709|nr:sugar transferase [Butyrivibrio sp. CB08]
MICIVISYLIATWLRYHDRNDYGDKTLHYMVCVVFLLFCVIYSFLADWNRDFIKRGYALEAFSVVKSISFILFTSLIVVFFLQWAYILSRLVVVYFVLIDVVLTFIFRVMFKKALWRHISNEKNVTRVVVIAENSVLDETVRTLEKQVGEVGYKIVGAYSSDGIEDITARLVTDPFDEVFINTPSIAQSEIEDSILKFEEMGVTTHYNLELPSITKAVPQVEKFMGYSVVTYTMNRTSYKRLFIKRVVDIIGAIVGLVITGVITIFLAPAIKLDSHGPVFFSQTRVGKNGRRFKIYKFRSMYVDAEERKKELEDKNEMNGLMFKIEDDPRVTRVGKFIRKTSLDEFPQFFNVLKGDMSLVGTRPPTEAEFEQYNEHYRRRLSMTPGLTGLWQISGRSDIDDFDEVVKLDLQYIDNWSLTEDIKILLKTVGVVLFGRGAK